MDINLDYNDIFPGLQLKCHAVKSNNQKEIVFLNKWKIGGMKADVFRTLCAQAASHQLKFFKESHARRSRAPFYLE